MMTSNLRKSEKTYEYAYWGALKRFDLSPSEFIILFLIRGLAKKKGECYASKKFLAERLNMSQPTVFNGIKKLEKKRLIKRVGTSKYGTESLNITEEFEKYLDSLKGMDAYDERYWDTYTNKSNFTV